MAGEYDYLVSTLTQLLQRVQAEVLYHEGLLGNGFGTVFVPNRTGYAYVRMLTDTSKIIEVLCTKLDGYDGMPVIVGEFPWQPGITQVLDVDWRVFASSQTPWLQPYLPKHGITHNSKALDPADIDKDNWRELHTHPFSASGPWFVEVSPDFYLYQSGRTYFPGGQIDLTLYATGVAHFITVYIDGSTNMLSAINGQDIPGGIGSSGYTTISGSSVALVTLFPTPPVGSVICGTAIYDPAYTTSVTAGGIIPDRSIWTPVGGVVANGGASGVFVFPYTSTPADVASAGNAGGSVLYARGDHIHKGVHSASASGSAQLFGDVIFYGASGTVVTQSGNSIIIAGSGGTIGSSATPADVASAGAAGVGIPYSREDHIHRGVHSVSATGSAQLFGDVLLRGASGTIVTQSGNTILIASTNGPDGSNATPAEVGSAGSAGVDIPYSRDDHIHKGVHSVSATGSAQLFGDVLLQGASGTVVSQSGNTIFIAGGSNSPFDGTPSDVAATAAAGSSALYSRGDHIHKGVHSVSATGSAQLFGDVLLTGASGTVVSQSGNTVIIASSNGADGSNATPAEVGTTGAAGVDVPYSRDDHIHKGVHSVSASGSAQLFGDILFQGVSGTVVSQQGNTISIAGGIQAPGTPYDGTPADVDSFGASGTSSLYSRGDHIHRGVHSVSATGSVALFGDILLQGASGTVISQQGNTIFVAAGAGTGGANPSNATPADVTTVGAAGVDILYSRGDHAHKGVHSVSATGSTPLYGDILFQGVSGTIVSQSGNTILIAGGAGVGGSTPYDGTPADVAAVGASGTSSLYSRGDHIHKGVHSISATGSVQLFGDVLLQGASGTIISQQGNTIFVASTNGPDGSNATPADVGSVGSAGIDIPYSRDDHVHKGVHSISITGSAQLFGDVIFRGASGVIVQESGNTISILGAGGTDTTAIHTNVAGEISTITEKTTPVSTDLIVIEDSAASNSKKKVQLGNLPGAVPPSLRVYQSTTFT